MNFKEEEIKLIQQKCVQEEEEKKQNMEIS